MIKRLRTSKKQIIRLGGDVDSAEIVSINKITGKQRSLHETLRWTGFIKQENLDHWISRGWIKGSLLVLDYDQHITPGTCERLEMNGLVSCMIKNNEIKLVTVANNHYRYLIKEGE